MLRNKELHSDCAPSHSCNVAPFLKKAEIQPPPPPPSAPADAVSNHALVTHWEADVSVMNLSADPSVDVMCGSVPYQGQGEACLRPAWYRWKDSVLEMDLNVLSRTGN